MTSSTFKNFFNNINESRVEQNTLLKINNAIESAGGEIFVVGGTIRDFLLGHEPKDIDFLVRKLPLEEINKILSHIGKSGEVGESFGIVKCTIDGEEFDFAIPRTKEEKTGEKHTDFTVQVDPEASVEDDLKRRDFTWNAMAVPLKVYINVQGYPKEKAIELLKGALIDPNGGLSDLESHSIRAVGDPRNRFGEDPLRMLRALQFATRMGFDISGDTAEAIKELAPTLKTVPGERVFEEFKKAWTKGKADTETFVKLLWKLNIGETLFGEDFNPYIVKLPSLSGEEKVAGQLVAFFINGGDYNSMKVDTKFCKLIETAKIIKDHESEYPYPFVYIGNLVDKDLNVLSEVFKEIDSNVHIKVEKMRKVPLRGKELAVDGPTIAHLLGITDKKDFPKIGAAQKQALAALWDGKIQNTPKDLSEFISAKAITEEYFKSNLKTKENQSFSCEEELDEAHSAIIEEFIKHALSFLRLSEKPKIQFVTTRRNGMTHGCFTPSTDEILVYIKNRSIADYLRTLAHELVHFHQRVTGKVEPDGNYPAIGGPVEDEANAVGGQIIKSFGKKNPKVYDL
jgi:tRNA nucleotidyltransferase/poly(A) polymerase